MFACFFLLAVSLVIVVQPKNNNNYCSEFVGGWHLGFQQRNEARHTEELFETARMMFYCVLCGGLDPGAGGAPAAAHPTGRPAGRGAAAPTGTEGGATARTGPAAATEGSVLRSTCSQPRLERRHGAVFCVVFYIGYSRHTKLLCLCHTMVVQSLYNVLLNQLG